LVLRGFRAKGFDEQGDADVERVIFFFGLVSLAAWRASRRTCERMQSTHMPAGLGGMPIPHMQHSTCPGVPCVWCPWPPNIAMVGVYLDDSTTHETRNSLLRMKCAAGDCYAT
jgi:hypothetical protein